MVRYLKAKGSPRESFIGFAGRVARIARVHQYGLENRAENGAFEVRYAHRKLLGLTKQDINIVEEALLAKLTIQKIN